IESTPIYALHPTGPFADEVYVTLQQLLAGQAAPEDSAAYIERVSIPGHLAECAVHLFSGQVVPIVTLVGCRGLYGWAVNTLVRTALDAARSGQDNVDESVMRRSLHSFLQRVYHDLSNEGRTARDRALNFAATNTFQAAVTFAAAVASGMELDRIEVGKSPF